MEKQIEETIKLLKANGYSVYKKKETVKKLPCVCGRKRLARWWVCGSSEGNEFYECPKCGLKGGIGKNNREALLLWNEAVEKAKEEK